MIAKCHDLLGDVNLCLSCLAPRLAVAQKGGTSYPERNLSESRAVHLQGAEKGEKAMSSPEIGLHLFQPQNARCTASGVLYFSDR